MGPSQIASASQHETDEGRKVQASLRHAQALAVPRQPSAARHPGAAGLDVKAAPQDHEAALRPGCMAASARMPPPSARASQRAAVPRTPGWQTMGHDALNHSVADLTGMTVLHLKQRMRALPGARGRLDQLDRHRRPSLIGDRGRTGRAGARHPEEPGVTTPAGQGRP